MTIWRSRTPESANLQCGFPLDSDDCLARSQGWSANILAAIHGVPKSLVVLQVNKPLSITAHISTMRMSKVF